MCNTTMCIAYVASSLAFCRVPQTGERRVLSGRRLTPMGRLERCTVAAPAGPSPNDQPRRLGGDPGARVWELATPLGEWVLKRADPAQVARETDMLARLAGSGLAPDLVAAGEGILITGRVDGAPRPAASWSADQAGAVGRLLALVHRRPAPASVEGAPASRGRLIADIRRDCRPGLRAITAAAIAALPSPEPGARVLLHGDPWSANIVWSAAGPVLVDWEYARGGEPAEDLAYLSALDELSDATLDEVLRGYGADPALAARVRAWRPLMAAWCGSWLCDRGAGDRGARLVAHAERLLLHGAGQ